MFQGGSREGGRGLQGIGLALGRAEGAAQHARRGIGRHFRQIGALEPFDLEAMGPLDGHLALDIAALRFGLGQQDAAAEGDLEIGTQFGLQPAHMRMDSTSSEIVGAKALAQPSPSATNGSWGIWACRLPALDPEAWVLRSYRSTRTTSIPS